MVKLEIELTDVQHEKVKRLQSHGISVGEAIDMLFEVQEKVLDDIDTIDDEKIGVFDKITDFKVESKAENLDENYGEGEKTYELKAQEVKHKVSWARDFFKF